MSLRAQRGNLAPPATRIAEIASSPAAPRNDNGPTASPPKSGAMTPRHIAIGDITIGNDLPLVFIVGPNTLESRAHALEMSAALAEIAAGLGIALIYKTSFDKANRSSIGGRARHRARRRIADPRRNSRTHRPAGADRRAREGAVRAGRRSRRCAADAGVSVPPDRSAAGRGHDRQAGQRQEGPVPRALGYAARRGQDRLDRQPPDPLMRARRELRLQHPDRRHARPADHGADRLSGGVRRDPRRGHSRAGSATARAASANSPRCWPAPRSQSASPRCSSRPTRTPTMRPAKARRCCRCAPCRHCSGS